MYLQNLISEMKVLKNSSWVDTIKLLILQERVFDKHIESGKEKQ